MPQRSQRHKLSIQGVTSRGETSRQAISKGTHVAEVTGVSAASFTTSTVFSVANNERALICPIFRAAGNITIDSVTIGGKPCSPLVEFEQSTGSPTGFYYGPMGQGGVVTVVCSGTFVRGAVGFWPVKNMNVPIILGQAVVDNIASGQVGSANMQVNAGGAAFGVAYCSAVVAPCMAWAGIVEDSETNTATGANPASFASQVFAAAQSSLPISCTLTGTPNNFRTAIVSIV